MQADVKEAFGFLFRWALLGLSGLFALGVGFVLFDPSGLTGIRNRELVIPDFVIPADKITQVWGFHTTRGNERTLLSLSGSQESWPLIGTAFLERVAITLPSEPEGISIIQTVGSPYSPTAFNISESLLLRMAKGSRGFLIDAEAVINSDNARDFGPGLEELSQIGEVAIFCQGPFDQYPALRDRLRSKVGPVPAVYLAHRDGRVEPWLGSGRRAIGAFDRAGASRIDLITDNPDLAAEVAQFVPFYRRTDVRIHLINPPAGQKKDKAVFLHEDWAAAVRSLSSPAADQDRDQPGSHKSK